MKTDGTNPQTVKAPAANAAGASLRHMITTMTPQIAAALPSTVTPERMCRIAMTAISRNEKLASCTPNSFMGALLTAAQLGLECNTPLGQAYLIPFNNKGKLETEFQLGYQGLLDLCYRTKQYKTIQARIVYKGDFFEYSYGLDEKLEHKPMDQSEEPIYVYAYYELINGAKAFEVMTWNQVMKFAKKYSKASNYGPWTTDPESMAKKTLLKKVLKYAPKSVEVAEAVAQDSAIITTKTIQDNGNVIVDKDILNTSIIDAVPEQKPETETSIESINSDIPEDLLNK